MHRSLSLALAVLAALSGPAALASDASNQDTGAGVVHAEREQPLSRLVSGGGRIAQTSEAREARREARRGRLQAFGEVVQQALEEAVEVALEEAARLETARLEAEAQAAVQAEAEEAARQDAAQQQATQRIPASPSGALADALRGKKLYHLHVNNGFSDDLKVKSR